MDILTPNDYVFPVFGGYLDGEGFFIPKDLYGTSFYIRNNFFLTCCHTSQNVKQNPICALGFLDENKIVQYKSIVDAEEFHTNDSAILIADIEDAKAFRWLEQDLIMLEEVISTGFPFGYDKTNNQLLTRSFKGHITLAGNYHVLPDKPEHYELSYICPKGISGAPLLCKVEEELVLCGMTIGNEITEIVVSSFKETVKGTNEVRTYERSESFHRGIAVRTKSFLRIKSKFLEGTFEEYLNRENLLIN